MEKIRVDGEVVTKPSHFCGEKVIVEVMDFEALEWVSRSGEKLFHALNFLELDLSSKTCLDVGQSTGGFT